MAVTVKRKISNETQRYGGFAEIEVMPQDTEIEIGDSFSVSEQKRAESSIEYSMPTIRTTPAATQKEEDVYKQECGQYMFNIRSAKAKESETQNATIAKQKLDKRTKLLLGVYLSVIVLLSALVIGTGIYLTSGNARVDALESELSVKSVVLNEQIAEIARLSDEDALFGRAVSNGMQQIDESEIIELLPIEDVVAYEGTTNWFDSFCDWLNGVVGG
ncbi:MAG: hypothetical protein IKC35_01835 [Clostridia bacterium]|nr:hypothetical protein [Clostridia bacterium]